MSTNMIYVITTLQTVYGYKNPVHKYELGKRTVGYFNELKVAQEAVENNAMGINECGYYPFCVIEEMAEGFYGLGGNFKEWWYQWIDDGYKIISKPASLEKTVLFGIG